MLTNIDTPAISTLNVFSILVFTCFTITVRIHAYLHDKGVQFGLRTDLIEYNIYPSAW